MARPRTVSLLALPALDVLLAEDDHVFQILDPFMKG